MPEEPKHTIVPESSGLDDEFSRGPSDRTNCRNLYFWLHAAEAGHHDQHAGRRDSRRDTAFDRLGRGPRIPRFSGVEFVRDSVCLADAPFLCHRLDVPPRLRARGISHAFRRR